MFIYFGYYDTDLPNMFFFFFMGIFQIVNTTNACSLSLSRSFQTLTKSRLGYRKGSSLFFIVSILHVAHSYFAQTLSYLMIICVWILLYYNIIMIITLSID